MLQSKRFSQHPELLRLETRPANCFQSLNEGYGKRDPACLTPHHNIRSVLKVLSGILHDSKPTIQGLVVLSFSLAAHVHHTGLSPAAVVQPGFKLHALDRLHELRMQQQYARTFSWHAAMQVWHTLAHCPAAGEPATRSNCNLCVTCWLHRRVLACCSSHNIAMCPSTAAGGAAAVTPSPHKAGRHDASLAPARSASRALPASAAAAPPSSIPTTATEPPASTAPAIPMQASPTATPSVGATTAATAAAAAAAAAVASSRQRLDGSLLLQQLLTLAASLADAAGRADYASADLQLSLLGALPATGELLYHSQAARPVRSLIKHLEQQQQQQQQNAGKQTVQQLIPQPGSSHLQQQQHASSGGAGSSQDPLTTAVLHKAQALLVRWRAVLAAEVSALDTKEVNRARQVGVSCGWEGTVQPAVHTPFKLPEPRMYLGYVYNGIKVVARLVSMPQGGEPSANTEQHCGVHIFGYLARITGWLAGWPGWLDAVTYSEIPCAAVPPVVLSGAESEAGQAAAAATASSSTQQGSSHTRCRRAAAWPAAQHI